MNNEVILPAAPELETLLAALVLLDAAITGLSFDHGRRNLFVHGSNSLTDQQVIDEAAQHPAIDHEAERTARESAAKAALGSMKTAAGAANSIPELRAVVQDILDRL